MIDGQLGERYRTCEKFGEDADRATTLSFDRSTDRA